MGVYIPNMKKPKDCEVCPFFILDGAVTDDNKWVSYSVCDLLGKTIGDADMLNDCPLIEIAEPTETIIHDIRKLIAFIEPRMIIASTYAEQIERAEEVKNWLLSIVGERRTDE